MSASAVLRRRLGKGLREVRQNFGVTQDALAERINVSLRTVLRAEAGDNTIGHRDLVRWLDVCDADPETRDHLIELGKQARRRGGWWSAYRDLLPGPYVQLEAEAAVVRNYEPSLVPGLLHTEAYAREVIAADPNPMDSEEIERRVTARMKRQERLTTSHNPLTLHVAIDEAVLYRPVGNSQITRVQFEWLVEAAELPNIDIRIIPFGTGIYPSVGNSFVIISFTHPIDPDVALVESPAGEKYLENASEVAMYHTVFSEMQTMALSEEDSISRVKELMAQLQHD